MQELSDRHFSALTDNFGIWQHTKGNKIDRDNGYALDDAARGLVVALARKDLAKARVFLKFLELACADQEWINFFDAQHKPLKKPISEDALGQVFWAVSCCIRAQFEAKRATALAAQIKNRVSTFRFVRSKSYALLGALYLNEPLAHLFKDSLLLDYKNNSDSSWQWVENNLAYGNAIIPYSLLMAGEYLNQKIVLENSLAMLRFLNKATIENDICSPVGCQGWYQKGGKKALYDQQPIDVGYQVVANIKAWEMTHDSYYLRQATICMEWFWGKNINNISMIDSTDDSVLDGLSENGVNVNRGAENIIVYLWAQHLYWPYHSLSNS